jgi:hypothetical protein
MDLIYILFTLFILFIILAIFVVVGHVIWLIAAAVLKWLFSSDDRDESFGRGTGIYPPPPPPSYPPPPPRVDDLTVF